jgi:leucyl/phenylalanyl-tRNA--protein transferase
MGVASAISPELLLMAYRQGVFPMADPDGSLSWYSPDPRGVIPLEDFHIPHGLKRTLAKARFEVRFNTAFSAVLDGCANRKETWIDGRIKRGYQELHRLGFAHSVEAWQGDLLGGGLYGVALGGAFFGESMFHTITDASKVALHGLVQRLRQQGFGLLDLQWVTPHLAGFGAREIPRSEYLRQLEAQLERRCSFVVG